MKKTYLYPALALVMGVVGYVLRRYQLRTDFDELNLPVPGLYTWLLIGLTIGCFVSFALLTLLLYPKRDWAGTMGTAPLPVLKGVSVLCLLSAAAFVLEQRSASVTDAIFQVAALILPLLMIVGALASAVGLWGLSQGGSPNALYPMLPGFCSCFWMVNSYHSYANDPVVLHFVWFILAVVVSALAWYELSGLALNQGHSRRTMYLCLMTIVLSMIALAGGEQISDQVLLGVQVISFLTISFRLADNP